MGSPIDWAWVNELVERQARTVQASTGKRLILGNTEYISRNSMVQSG